jgi:hypothetical protein
MNETTSPEPDDGLEPAAPADVQPVETKPTAAEGWYADPNGSGDQRYWNGSEWTERRSPSKTDEQRRAALAAQLQTMVAGHARIESQSEFQAVTVSGKPVNHILHLILSIITLGLWLFVWGTLGAWGGERRKLVTVDEFGTVNVQKV